MSFINDFTLMISNINIPYVAVKFKRNSVRSQRTAMCVRRMSFCQEHIVILLMLIVKHTHSR